MPTAAVTPLRAGPVFGLIAAITVFAITMGLTYPLLSLQLEALGVSNTLIGVSAAMTPLGMIASAPFMAAFMRHVHPVPFLLCCIAMTTVLLIMLATTQDFVAWLVLRFVIGLCLNGIHTVGESALQQITPDNSRGRVMGVYNALLIFGYVAGPAVLSLTGSAGWLPFVMGAALVSMAALPLVCLRRAIPRIATSSDDTRGSPLSFARMAPVLIVAYAVFAIFDNSSMSLVPIYAMEHGFSERWATHFLAVIMIGGVLLQFPIGLIADRCGIRIVMLVCSLLAVAGCAALPAAMASPATALVVGFLWGGAGFGVYTMALTELGQRFQGAQLVAGNVVFGFTWGVSAALGIPMTGGAMEHFGADGYMLATGGLFTVVAVCYAARLLFASGKKPAVGYA